MSKKKANWYARAGRACVLVVLVWFRHWHRRPFFIVYLNLDMKFVWVSSINLSSSFWFHLYIACKSRQLKYFILIRNNQKRVSFPGLALVSSAAIHHRGLDHLFIYCNFFEFDSWESVDGRIGHWKSLLFDIIGSRFGLSAAWTSSSSFGKVSALLRHINSKTFCESGAVWGIGHVRHVEEKRASVKLHFPLLSPILHVKRPTRFLLLFSSLFFVVVL